MNYIIDKTEVLRYLGINIAPPPQDVLRLIDECGAELLYSVRPKYVYKICSLNFPDGIPTLDCVNITLAGKTAADRLAGCTHVGILSATLGLEADTLIRRGQMTDMTRALIYDACATDLIEKVCDRAAFEIADIVKGDGLSVTDRFSPGYGDLPLDLQKSLCAILDTARKIGVSPTPTLLLVPSKSVTAFIGIGPQTSLKDNIYAACKERCDLCSMKNNCRFSRKNKPLREDAKNE
ncbi:MAG: methionine synthase [Clostridia bacterium]|nr:methionine synthase [Clostridia bacterium]